MKKLHFQRKHLFYLTDFVLTFGVVILAFLAYYGPQGFTDNIGSTLIYAGSVSLATSILFILFKVYKIVGIAEFSISGVIRISVPTLLVHLIGLLVIALVPDLPRFGQFFITYLFAIVVLLYGLPFSRLALRIGVLIQKRLQRTSNIRTLIIGAGVTGKVVMDEVRKNPRDHHLIVAFVDDNPNKIGGIYQNIPVKGPINDIKTIIEYLKIQEVVIAISVLEEERLHEILNLLMDTPVKVRRVPLLSEMEGPNDKRIIDVNLDDLLFRDFVKLDNQDVNSMLHGQTVLVTGAGGSIGSELVRQIYATRPAKLILFDIYENSTYDIQMELNRIARRLDVKETEVITLIGSTYNEYRIESVIKKYRPDYIYHAAAYKHVPLMEDSPMEAIRTNVLGTYNVARFADKYGVKKMILVSTDKAVRPTNVMGATKRFAETIIQYFDSKSENTRYAAVRFGNVLGSNGSVVPLFKKQIEEGGPITITDKRITRFFMTIPEAVSLILQCGLFASDGEIFILDMGEPVKIIDLAERLIRQAGLLPYVDINIVEIGLRPGEKLYEELLLDKEHQKKTSNSKIYIEEKESVNNNLEKDVLKASQAFNMPETSDIKDLLASLINTYRVDKR